MTCKSITQILLLMSICYFSSLGKSFAHSWMAPGDAAKIANPVALSNESISNGENIFTTRCSSCHGISAKGLPKEETGLLKDSPDLIARLKNHTDADFHWKILNGKGEMPSFKDDLSENDVWDIVNYLKMLKE